MVPARSSAARWRALKSPGLRSRSTRARSTSVSTCGRSCVYRPADRSRGARPGSADRRTGRAPRPPLPARCRCRGREPGRASRRPPGRRRRPPAARLARQAPDAADDLDRFVQRLNGLRGTQPPPADRLDRVPERASPSPRSTRPPLSRSRLAALRATTAGSRSGRLSTFAASRMAQVRAATKLSRVQVSGEGGLVGLVLEG
jgi:hypothetical protein